MTVRPTATAIYAGELMRADKLGCLPVTEEDGRLVGIVTLSDYLRLSVEFLRAHRQVED
ncbi:MAG: CBS domain-containing protein [Myxococcota bacterium]